LNECADLTGEIYEGLDVSREIRAVAHQSLGDTILLRDEDALVGFRRFGRLVDACDAFAAERGLGRLVAGVNLARLEAYQHLLSSGFRTDMQGVAMEWADDVGYNRRNVFVIDDWR
jgi:hypothetical protein